MYNLFIFILKFTIKLIWNNSYNNRFSIYITLLLLKNTLLPIIKAEVKMGLITIYDDSGKQTNV
jgi:hypothetical protein